MYTSYIRPAAEDVAECQRWWAYNRKLGLATVRVPVSSSLREIAGSSFSEAKSMLPEEWTLSERVP